MRIGFMWHSPLSGNLGVGALSVSNMLMVSSVLEEQGQRAEFVVFGPRIQSASKECKLLPPWRYIPLSSNLTSLRGSRRVMSELDSCGCVLDIGSGDSLSDIYGAKRFLKILLSKLLVRNGKQRLILSPQTFGPIRNPVFRALAQGVLRRSRQAFARDALSFEYLRSLVPGVSSRLSTDVAFSLPWDSGSVRGSAHRSRPVIGLNVSGLLFSGGYSGNNQFGLACDYQQTASTLVQELQRANKGAVVLVPHVTSPGGLKREDDHAAALLVAERHSGVTVCPPFQDAIEAKNYIADLDFFVGSRMHATIAAFSSGVPVVPLAYSRKFSGLYESLGYHRCIDLRAASTEDVVAGVLAAFRDRERLKREVGAASEKAQRLFAGYRDYLRVVLPEMAGRQ